MVREPNTDVGGRRDARESLPRLRSLTVRASPTYLIENTQTAPPSGTSGKLPGEILFKLPCIARASMPQPDCTAMYCLPSTVKDVGCPMIPELVGNSHNTAPVVASNARN